jgi:hypothetical protein
MSPLLKRGHVRALQVMYNLLVARFAALPERDGPQGRGYSRFCLADPISSIPLRTADATEIHYRS